MRVWKVPMSIAISQDMAPKTAFSIVESGPARAEQRKGEEAGGINATTLRRWCQEHCGLVLGYPAGLAPETHPTAFRIGHMGDLNEAMIFGTLGAVEAGLKGLQIPHGEGGVNAAIDSLLESDD